MGNRKQPTEPPENACKPAPPPAPPQARLVSDGWSQRCGVCSRQTHAKWHSLAQCELNPVALIEWIEAMPHELGTLATKTRIIGYILGCTGIDYQQMSSALAIERQKQEAYAKG